MCGHGGAAATLAGAACSGLSPARSPGESGSGVASMASGCSRVRFTGGSTTLTAATGTTTYKARRPADACVHQRSSNSRFLPRAIPKDSGVPAMVCTRDSSRADSKRLASSEVKT